MQQAEFKILSEDFPQEAGLLTTGLPFDKLAPTSEDHGGGEAGPDADEQPSDVFHCGPPRSWMFKRRLTSPR